MTVDSAIPEPLCCVPPPPLPDHLVIAAAADAVRLNPANAPSPHGLRSLAAALNAVGQPPVLTPLHIASLTSAYWGAKPRTLSVSFMESTSNALASKILQCANMWNCSVKFALTSGQGDVRISRGPGGYWSYLGTGILSIPRGQQTMNLEGFTVNSPDSEFLRVVCHEVGHTLSFVHEHMRKELVALIDPTKAIPYFERTQGWSEQEIYDQVLTPLDDRTLMETPPDQTSIMCYQIEGSVTYSGQPIIGGTQITANDAAFAQKLYPVATTPTVTPTPTAPTPTPTTPDVSGGVVVNVPVPGEYLIHTTLTKR